MKGSGFVRSYILCFIFLIYTALQKLIDVQAIGPEGSEIGFASLNGAVFALTGGPNAVPYALSEMIGWMAFGICGFFGIIGLVQLIRRRSFRKVDPQILILGAFYIVVIALYFLFTVLVVNYRPVLENGVLESSYPSSHTMLATCVFAAAAFYTRFLPERLMHLRKPLISACYIIIAAMLGLRILSGVHWLTDIVGGVLLSLTLISVLVTAVRKLC